MCSLGIAPVCCFKKVFQLCHMKLLQPQVIKILHCAEAAATTATT